MKPEYVYVASSWRNPLHAAVIATLQAANIPHYNFRDEEGFHWSETGLRKDRESPVTIEDYLKALDHPRSIEGFHRDFDAMSKADTFVLVLPAGRSAHLEMGWAVGQGKRTAILLLEDPIEPDLMYKMVDYLSPSLFDLLGWLGVED